jgi:aminopeptidase
VDETSLARYADVAVEVGMNLQPGQIVAVTAPPDAAPLVHAVARASYRRGAKFVDAIYFDPDVKRIRLEEAAEETLEFVPSWYGERLLAFRDQHVARCSFAPLVPPGALDGVDPVRAGNDRMPFLKETFAVINAMTTNWTIIGWPSEPWARALHPDLAPAAAVEQLWRDIAFTCRLDTDDPVAALRARFDELRTVAQKLTDHHFDAVHFEGPETDLTIGLLPESIWNGGTITTADGIVHAPNIPTEEVSSAPDPARVDGHVRATKPLDVAGSVVNGLRVRFANGRAVEIDADENADVLRGRVATDEGAARLGEVALVDRAGRVGQVESVFFNTLFDENAASHIALGNAYDFSAPGGEDKINQSAIHIDFMIGGDDVSVTGITRGGERVPLLRGGDWQI